MNKELMDYYNGDDFVSGVWLGKYALKDTSGKCVESTPKEMHERLAKELARKESENFIKDGDLSKYKGLSKAAYAYKATLKKDGEEKGVFDFLDRYKYIIPQGSIMTMLGNQYKIGSLSNCFVVPAPNDSYGGILKTDEHLVQLMKRRGGVGTNLNNLRPEDTPVSNAAGTSTGAVSFMERYSNSTREVAQNGRRGALMLLMSCKHPSIFNFTKIKQDRTKVTGANVSVMLTDKFMDAVIKDDDFFCRFPIDKNMNIAYPDPERLEYNKLISVKSDKEDSAKYIMKIRAKELFDNITEMAWENAEPGVAYMDTVINYSPDGIYDEFKPIASNPCGEQWMQAYDACRLLALNLFSIVVNPYEKNAYIDYDVLYNISYAQQRLADIIVDLEVEYIERIIKKIESDPEPDVVKRVELELWNNIKTTAINSRRTGCGFTALGDMLAAIGLRYDSDKSINTIEKVVKTKMRAELDASIDLAILRGTFNGWDRDKEFSIEDNIVLKGNNIFYQMLMEEFSEQVEKMCLYGRRNVSWSTVNMAA